MTTKRKSETSDVEIRKVVLSWPNLMAEASINVAVKRGAPEGEAGAIGRRLLQMLIMQEAVSTSLPEAGSDPTATGELR